MCCLPRDALLLEKLTVSFTEVVHAPRVVLAAVEREREPADLEASLDHLGGDGCPRPLAPRRHLPTPRRLQLARLGVFDRRRSVSGVLPPHQPLHLLVEHAVQRLEERSQPAWNQDDDGAAPLEEVGDESFVSVALEVVQHQDAPALLYDAAVAGSQLPALRGPKGALPCVAPALLLHAERRASRRVPVLGTVPRRNLCRDGTLARLNPRALPRRRRRDERRALEDDAQRNLAAVRHDSKTKREALLLLACGGIIIQ